MSKTGEGEKTLWDYFVKGESNENAKCLLCDNILKISQRSRKGLITHLKSKHCIQLQKSKPQESSQPVPSTSKNDLVKNTDCKCDDIIPKKKIKKIDSYFVKEYSMEKMISRMVAKDGLTFNCFCTSEDLRHLFSKCGFYLPTSPNTIRSIVENYSDFVKTEIIKELQSLINRGQRLSLTFDEWTSQKNQRYLNVNVHNIGTHFSLGLIRIYGSCTAEHCISLIKERLNNFGLDLETHIIGMTTDGASVMRKVGKLMSCYQQLCYAHGIQLAVVDILYKNNINKGHEICSSQNEEITSSVDSNKDDDIDDYNDETNEEQGLAVTVDQPPGKLISNYNDLINKVRKVVKVFKKSPTKNDAYLQKYVQQELGKNLSLILDCRTRWNSLLNMLERFYSLRMCISKALIDVASEIQISEEEWNNINNLNLSLQPLKLGVEVLCRRDSTLVTADTTFRFILEKLDKQQGLLCAELATALRQRIKERRTDLTGILIYLNNPKKYEQDLKKNDYTFALPKKNLMRQEMKKILERVIENNDINNEIEESATSANVENEDILQRNLSIQEELEIQLQEEKRSTYRQREIKKVSDYDKVLKKEMTDYECDGIKGKYLSIIYDYLMTIAPTSVEAERAFSAAGYICSSLRSRLGDETINTICFLRSYFQK